MDPFRTESAAVDWQVESIGRLLRKPETTAAAGAEVGRLAGGDQDTFVGEAHDRREPAVALAGAPGVAEHDLAFADGPEPAERSVVDRRTPVGPGTYPIRSAPGWPAQPRRYRHARPWPCVIARRRRPP